MFPHRKTNQQRADICFCEQRYREKGERLAWGKKGKHSYHSSALGFVFLDCQVGGCTTHVSFCLEHRKTRRLQSQVTLPRATGPALPPLDSYLSSLNFIHTLTLSDCPGPSLLVDNTPHSLVTTHFTSKLSDFSTSLLQLELRGTHCCSQGPFFSSNSTQQSPPAKPDHYPLLSHATSKSRTMEATS